MIFRIGGSPSVGANLYVHALSNMVLNLLALKAKRRFIHRCGFSTLLYCRLIRHIVLGRLLCHRK